MSIDLETSVARRDEDKCRACAELKDQDWRVLPLLRSMGAAEVAPFLTTPWVGRVIEVRQCLRCGRGVARGVSSQVPHPTQPPPQVDEGKKDVHR